MIPSWYWPWVRWRLGEGEFKGDPKNPARRPAEVPSVVPVWAWQKLAAFLARRKALPPSPPVEIDRGLAFWRRMGMWVTRIDHFPVSYCVSYGQDQYRYVIVPCLYGVNREDHTEGLAEYVKGLQGLGFHVAGSQWGAAPDIPEAEREAEAAARAVAEFGFDGWVMNGEKKYEGGGRSGAYIRRFRLRYPNLPFGWTPEPHISLDYLVFRELGVCYMPQAYPLENHWTVEMVVEVALRDFGMERQNIVPLIQAYPDSYGVRYQAASYREQARRAGVPALILYPANQVADMPSFWRDLVV